MPYSQKTGKCFYSVCMIGKSQDVNIQFIGRKPGLRIVRKVANDDISVFQQITDDRLQSNPDSTCNKIVQGFQFSIPILVA